MSNERVIKSLLRRGGSSDDDTTNRIALAVNGIVVDSTANPFDGAGQPGTVIGDASGSQTGVLADGAYTVAATTDLFANSSVASAAPAPTTDTPAQSSTGLNGAASKQASGDADGAMQPNLSVNAANPADVTFIVSGLESGYAGAVTFTDWNGKSDVVAVSGNGNYSANLSNLANGSLTYEMTVSNAAGNIINVDPTTTLGDPWASHDGSLNAPAGSPQYPNLLSAYAVRPPWQVAGVDYAVGLPAGTALKDPATLTQADIGPNGSINASTHVITINNNNITLSGWNFALEGGWEIDDYAANTTITDCNLATGSNGNALIWGGGTCSNLTVTYSNLVGANSDTKGLGDVLTNGPGLTVQYCYIADAPADFVDCFGGGTINVEYNLCVNNGLFPTGHPDWFQIDAGNFNITYDYNTIYMNSAPAEVTQGIGFEGNTPWSLNGVNEISNNTVVTSAGTGVSFFSAVDPSGIASGASVSVNDNYIDPTGAAFTSQFLYRANEPPIPQSVYYNNFNMVTGSAYAQNVTSVTNVSSSQSGVEVPGNKITLTLNLSGVVTVTGIPTLTFNDGGTAIYTGGSGTNGLTFSYTVGASDAPVSALAITQINLPNGATITSGSNAVVLSDALISFPGLQIASGSSTTSVTSLGESPATGELNAGATVTLTLNLSAPVTVNTAGGTPTLTLNDGGAATYTHGSGTGALTFSYTVGATDNSVSTLVATAVNLNGATIIDGSGKAANLSLTGLTQTGPEIDAKTPSVTSVAASPSNGVEIAGDIVTLTLNMNEAVTVAGGIPTLTLNDGGTASYTGGSGTNALTFSYTVGASDNSVSALGIKQVNLPSGTTITDGAGNTANLAGAATTFAGLQVAGWSNSSFQTQTGTFTASFDATPSAANADVVIGLSPTAANAYTSLAAIIRFNSTADGVANPGTIDVRNGSTYSANVSVPYSAATNYHFVMVVDVATDTYSVYVTPQGGSQIALATNYSFRTEQAADSSLADIAENSSTTATTPVQNFSVGPTILSVAESPSTGNLNAGNAVTLTLTMSEVVNVTTTGGTPTLTLNDGGTATYTGGSGTNALTFSYTVGAGQSASSLAATVVNLDGATITDSAGNVANLSLIGLAQAGPEIVISGIVVSGSNSPWIVSNGQADNGDSIVNGGTEIVSSGGTTTSATVSAGGTLEVQSGGTVSGVTVSSGGTLEFLAGASDPALTVLSGGTLEIGAGYTETGYAVSNGVNLDVTSGGTVNGTTVSSGGHEFVLHGGHTSGTRVYAGGVETVSSGGLDGGTTLVGGTEYVMSGGVDPGTVVSSGGMDVIYGTTTDVTVMSGGETVVSSGGVTSGTQVNAGGLAYVLSGGVDSGATLVGGTEFVMTGGTASGAVLSGGAAAVYGVATGTTVSSGGILYTDAGGAASGTRVSAGGLAYVLSGGVDSGATLVGGIEFVMTGGTASGTVLSGGAAAVYGVATGTTVSSGGILYTDAGGAASATRVSAGGLAYVLAGGVDSGATLVGGTEFVMTGGTASGTVLSGGAEAVYGVATGTTVSSGGILYTDAGGAASGTRVSAGGLAYVLSGGVDSGATLVGGTEFVMTGGTASGTVLSGGAEAVYGVATGTTVSSGGILYTDAGGAVSGTRVSAGGLEYLLSGGVDSGATLVGGTEFVMTGGTASGTVLSGGAEAVYGVATGTTVSSGGILYTDAGGAVSGTRVSAGGLAYVLSGGVDSGATLVGGTEFVMAGGTASGTVLSAGAEAVYGVATGTTVSSGGILYADAGGAASGTRVSAGGLEYVLSGGVDSGTTVSSGGTQYVNSGGVANGTTLSSGSDQYVFLGGIAENTTVLSGGHGVAYSGSTVSGATISGGTFELQNGANEAGTFNFASGGMLTLDGTGTYNMLVAGFTSATAEIDLTSLNYTGATVSFAEASNNTSGTLTIANGASSASVLLLGNYVAGAASFTLEKDSGGGTIVFDPPVVADTNPNGLAVPHHS